MTSNFHIEFLGVLLFLEEIEITKYGKEPDPSSVKLHHLLPKLLPRATNCSCSPEGSDCQRQPGFHFWRRQLLYFIHRKLLCPFSFVKINYSGIPFENSELQGG